MEIRKFYFKDLKLNASSCGGKNCDGCHDEGKSCFGLKTHVGQPQAVSLSGQIVLMQAAIDHIPIEFRSTKLADLFVSKSVLQDRAACVTASPNQLKEATASLIQAYGNNHGTWTLVAWIERTSGKMIYFIQNS